ncbi:MAG: lipopolysaccharide export system permease protein [Lentimonas sp.]|jgi:lipopolysaccharide export system permease protein
MSLIDRYILKEWVQGFALILGLIVGILILQNMYDSLPDLLGMNARPEEIVFYYTLALPIYLPLILPIAFLVSLLFSLGNLHRNNEIVAMRASGAGLLRISRSLWCVGIALTGLIFYLTASLVPFSVEQSRTFINNLEYKSEEGVTSSKDQGLVHNLGFDNRKDRRLWFMDRFSERAWLGLGVNVFIRGEDGQELERILASEAYFDDTMGHWVFLKGRELVFDPETGDPIRTITFEEKVFDAFYEDPSLMLALHKDPKELSIFELRRIIETIPPEENPAVLAYLMRYHSLLAGPFSCLVVVGLAVPLSVSGVRSNPMIGVLVCMGCLLVFYLLTVIATILGELGIVPPLIAAWVANVVMFGTGIGLFRRAS